MITACLLAGLTCFLIAAHHIMVVAIVFCVGLAGAALAWVVRKFQIRAPYKILIFNIILGGIYGYCFWLFINYFANQSANRHPMPSGTELYLTVAVITAVSLVFVIFLSLLPWHMAWKPYSEACKRWATEVKLPYTIAFVFDVKEAKKSFEAGDFSLLFNERLKTDMPHSTFTLYYVQEDSECYYLSVVNVMGEKDGYGGKQTIKEKKVIKNVKITLSDFKKFQARFNPQPVAASTLHAA